LTLSRVAIAALIAATAATTAAANVLVVRSSGPSASAYAPGKSLPDNARLQLRAGDTVVVLGANGTRTFRGPGNFSPSSAVQAGSQTVQGSAGRARVGAVRSAPIIPSSNPASIWQVDPTQSGTACLVPSIGVKLWRANSGQTETLTITGPDGRAQTVQWVAGQAMLDWPSTVSLANNADYQLRLSGSPVPARIHVRTLDRPPQSVQEVAETLIRNQCTEQLDLLVAAQPSL
jgi:hypothetical protein